MAFTTFAMAFIAIVMAFINIVIIILFYHYFRLGFIIRVLYIILKQGSYNKHLCFHHNLFNKNLVGSPKRFPPSLFKTKNLLLYLNIPNFSFTIKTYLIKLNINKS